MALFAIGDFHLCFANPDKDMARFGEVWKHREEKIRRNFAELVSPEDTTVIVGDHSWGKHLSEARIDLDFIAALPGRKILLRGNHDMFWPSNKTAELNRLYNPRLFFLQNNFYAYEDYALVGTKGFTFEGPFWINRENGNIISYDAKNKEHADKLVEREAKRLELSFQAAEEEGYHKFIMFLHYPPTNIMEKDSLFTRIAEEHNVTVVVYAHCHGKARFHDSIQGRHNGVLYTLVSGDYLNFCPERIL